MNQGDDSGNDCDQLPVVPYGSDGFQNGMDVDCDEWFHTLS
jgi:hypothetical protein